MHLKPKVLCHPCNHDWGGKLEERIEPILTPMIRGHARTLTRDEQHLLSAWFTLKVMVSEYLIPKGRRLRRFFEPEQGQHLQATLRPPEGVSVWIGRYVGTRKEAGWIMDRSSAREVSAAPRAGVFWHSVTYSIGQVLLHMFATSRPILLDDSLRDRDDLDPVHYTFPWTPGDWQACLTRIWEPRDGPLSWPPQKAFDDKAFLYLADRWNPQESPSMDPPPEVPEAGGESA